MGDRPLNRSVPASGDSVSRSKTARAVLRSPLRSRLVRLSRCSTLNPSACRRSRSRAPTARSALRLASRQSVRAGTPCRSSCSANSPSLLRPGRAASSDGSACDRKRSAACRSGCASVSRQRRSTCPTSIFGWTGGVSPAGPQRAAPPGCNTTTSTGATRPPLRVFQHSSTPDRVGVFADRATATSTACAPSPRNKPAGLKPRFGDHGREVRSDRNLASAAILVRPRSFKRLVPKSLASCLRHQYAARHQRTAAAYRSSRMPHRPGLVPSSGSADS